MNCACGVDHWLHVAAGFQGIVGMMVVLDAADVPPSNEALAKMIEQLAKLEEQVRRQREKNKA